jgi:hypothetical protein
MPGTTGSRSLFTLSLLIAADHFDPCSNFLSNHADEFPVAIWTPYQPSCADDWLRQVIDGSAATRAGRFPGIHFFLGRLHSRSRASPRRAPKRQMQRSHTCSILEAAQSLSLTLLLIGSRLAQATRPSFFFNMSRKNHSCFS